MRRIVTGVAPVGRTQPNKLRISLAEFATEETNLMHVRRAFRSLYPGCRVDVELSAIRGRLIVHRREYTGAWTNLDAVAINNNLLALHSKYVVVNVAADPLHPNTHLVFLNRRASWEDQYLLRLVPCVAELVFLRDYGESVMGALITDPQARERLADIPEWDDSVELPWGHPYRQISDALRIDLSFAE